MADNRQSADPFNRLLAGAVAALLLSIYLFQLDFLPPRWEEPRRCIVAFEMIERGEYIVPSVYGELYTKKPPLQNWIIAALSNFETDRITVLIPRLVSVFSVIATASILMWLAWSLGLPHPALALVVFLTFGIQIQYGRSGAIDPLFVLWTTAALASFFWGIERDRPLIAWGVSQTFIALGVLTKGLAPVFVYPPILVFLLVEQRFYSRIAVRWRHALLGFAAFLIFVGLWLVPFARSGVLTELGTTGADEVLSRTPVGSGATEFLRGLVRFPVEVSVNLLPWSLFGVGLVSRRVRESILYAWSKSRLLRFCAVTFACTTCLLWLMPGSLGRYAMPAYPFFALGLSALVSRNSDAVAPMPWTWSALWPALGAVWLALAGYRFATRPGLSLWVPAVVCIAAVLVAMVSDRRPMVSRSVRVAAFLGFVYSAFFAMIHGPSRAQWDRERRISVAAMADIMEADAVRRGLDIQTVPIGCAPGVNQAVCFEVMQRLDRSVTLPSRNQAPAYAIGHVNRSDLPSGRETLAKNRFDLELWFRGSEIER